MRVSFSAIASFVAGGFFAQLAQILLLRELLVVLDGDELALGIMLAVWLVWVGVGAAVGTCWMRGAKAGRRYAGVVALAAISLPVVLLVVRLARPLFDAPLGTPLPLGDAIVLAFGGSALPCVCVGVLFPLLVRETGARPALVYGLEGVGALAGGLLFTFVLVGRASPVTIAAGVGAVSALVGAWLLRRLASVSGAWSSALGVLGVGFIVLAVFGQQVDEWGERERWARLLARYRLVETRESAYARYSLLESAGQFSLFGDGQHVCDLPDPHGGVLVTHTALLQHLAPRSVLLVTASPAVAAREARRHRSDRIDCVALDPIPLRLLRRHVPAEVFAALDADEVHVHEADPIRYLRDSSRSFDAIVVDVPDPTTLGLNRFYSREFFGLAARRLNAGGVLAVTISSQENYLGEELLARNALVYRTLRGVLPNTVAGPGDTCLLLARRNGVGEEWGLTLDAEVLDARQAERGVESAAYQALLYSDPFPEDRLWAVNRELAAWPESPARKGGLDWLGAGERGFEPPALNRGGGTNADLKPIAYWATRLVNVRKHEPEWLSVFGVLPGVAGYVLAGGVGLVGVVAIGAYVLGSARRRTTVGLTIASGAIGFAGMGLQMLILLWYQCRAGQVYIGLALLTAAFMAGLAVGSFVASLWRRQRGALLVVQSGLIAAVLASMVGWQRAVSMALATALGWTTVLGFVLGAHFACCAGLWPAGRGAIVRSARWLYAADLVGAALAAGLVAAVVIPVSGYGAARCWMAGFGGAALVATVLNVRYLAAGSQ